MLYPLHYLLAFDGRFLEMQRLAQKACIWGTRMLGCAVLVQCVCVCVCVLCRCTVRVFRPHGGCIHTTVQECVWGWG